MCSVTSRVARFLTILRMIVKFRSERLGRDLLSMRERIDDYMCDRRTRGAGTYHDIIAVDSRFDVEKAFKEYHRAIQKVDKLPYPSSLPRMLELPSLQQ
jgi:hypothetical protein